MRHIAIGIVWFGGFLIGVGVEKYYHEKQSDSARLSIPCVTHSIVVENQSSSDITVKIPKKETR